MAQRAAGAAGAWITVLGAALAAPALAAPPLPILGPELTLDPPVLTGATGEQTETAAAWDGRHFLVAWQSTVWRNELRFARLDATGRVLDPRGVSLDELDTGRGRVAVATGGGVFLLAWARAPDRVLAAVIRTQPSFSWDPPVAVSTGHGDTFVRGPKVAWDGQHFWVVFSRGGQEPGVFATRIAPDGRVLDAVPLRLSEAFSEVAVAARSREALALFVEPAAAGNAAGAAAVLARRIAGDGPRPEPALPVFSPVHPQSQPAVATDGEDYLAVVSTAVPAVAASEVRARRLGPDGAALDATELALAPPAAGTLSEPSVAWAGQRFVVLWSRSGAGMAGAPADGVEGATVAADGALGPVDRGFTQLGRHPVVVPAASGPYVFWDEVIWRAPNGDVGDSDVFVAPLAPSPVAPPTLISTGTNWQSEPVVAWNGSALFLAWEDRREDRFDGDIYGIRVDGTGRPLDPRALAIATGPGTQSAPAVAWDGSRFVVVFRQADGSLGNARVTGAGALEDAQPVPIPKTVGAGPLSDPAACASAGGALFAWARRPDGAGPRPTRLEVLRVASGASPAGATPVLLTTTADDEGPAVVRLGCNDGAALVVWSGVLLPGEESDLHSLRFDPRLPAPVPDAAILRLGPRVRNEWAGVASDGAGFLVAWRGFNSAGQRTVFATRIDAAGTRLDEPALTIGRSNSGVRVTTVWDGRQYVVLAVNTAGGNPFELRGRRVSPGGEVLDSAWFVASVLSKPWGGGGAGAEGVTVAPGLSFFTYEQYPEEDGAGNPRTRGRFVAFPAATAPPSDGGPAGDGGAPLDGPAASEGGSGCGCRAPGQGPRGAGGLYIIVCGAALLEGRLRRRRTIPTRFRRARPAPAPPPPTWP